MPTADGGSGPMRSPIVVVLPKGASFFRRDSSGERHQYVVISDPLQVCEEQHRGSVLCVNLTSASGWSDRACVIQATELRSLTHETVVYYEGALLQTAAQLRALDPRSAGPLVTSELVAKIQRGALLSEDTKELFKEYLRSQGVPQPALAPKPAIALKPAVVATKTTPIPVKTLVRPTARPKAVIPPAKKP